MMTVIKQIQDFFLKFAIILVKILSRQEASPGFKQFPLAHLR